jgi:hypothetical protein
MAYTSSAVLPRSAAIPKIAQRPKQHPKRSPIIGVLVRLFDAIERSNMQRAEREIARYLRTNKFTDETEREIERRYFAR